MHIRRRSMFKLLVLCAVVAIFFGIPTSIDSAPTRLVLKSGIHVIPGVGKDGKGARTITQFAAERDPLVLMGFQAEGDRKIRTILAGEDWLSEFSIDVKNVSTRDVIAF